jgi:hypothetical protein
MGFNSGFKGLIINFTFMRGLDLLYEMFCLSLPGAAIYRSRELPSNGTGKNGPLFICKIEYEDVLESGSRVPPILNLGSGYRH